MIGRGLKHLGFKPGIDFNCQDDGEGPYIAEWLSETPQPAFEDILAAAEATPVPDSVTPNAARKAINAAGLRQAVEAAVAAASQDVKDDWEYAPVIRRNSPTVLALAAALGLSEAQLDALFISAAELSL